MPAPPTIFIICSDRSRNGKTLLARVLTDHLLIQEHDPFCFDLSAPEGALRAYFPGRTALIDFDQEEGRAKVFNSILARYGRDYVIDVPGALLAPFCEAAEARGFSEAAQAEGFRICVLFVIDRDEGSLKTAVAVEEVLQPDLMVPVANRFVGTALPKGVPGPVLAMERVDSELHPIVTNRRFSLRGFLLGDDAAVPVRLRANLQNFLHGLLGGLRDLEPELSLRTLREAELRPAKAV
ncbi:hypothetical protein [Aestuariivirga sp.]|uniref:hypothetical protein n=1 Tax=Aestuariivirga sp. TaxID=2650926 RepID=UPI003BAA05F8